MQKIKPIDNERRLYFFVQRFRCGKYVVCRHTRFYHIGGFQYLQSLSGRQRITIDHIYTA